MTSMVGGAAEVSLVMLFDPLLHPLAHLLQVPLQVVRTVAGQLVDDVLAVRLHGLLQDGLEDLTLHVVLQLLPRVTPETTNNSEAASGRG